MKGSTSNMTKAAGNPQDSQLISQVFDQYYAALCYFATGITNNDQEAEDIVLDTFRKFWSHSGNFESQQNIKAFLYITTRNACFNFLKFNKKKERDELEFSQHWITQQEENAEQLRIKAEVLRKINEEVDKLPRKCKEVFRLAYFEGLKANDIAMQLRISVNTVRNQKARALQLLRGVLTDKDLFIFFMIIAGMYSDNHLN